MRIYIDLDTYAIVRSPADLQPIPMIELKRGDEALFEVYFLRSGEAQSIGATPGLKFGAKPSGKYDAAAVVLCDEFVAPATATATAAITDGVVSGLAVVGNGANYETAPGVTLVGGDGSGAVVEATVTDGVVSGLTVVSGGTGYTTAPTVVIDPPPMKYVGYPNFSTVELDALFAIDGNEDNDPVFVLLMAEFTWGAASRPASTRTIALRVHNDVLRGGESLPADVFSAAPVNRYYEVTANFQHGGSGTWDAVSNLRAVLMGENEIGREYWSNAYWLPEWLPDAGNSSPWPPPQPEGLVCRLLQTGADTWTLELRGDLGASYEIAIFTGTGATPLDVSTWTGSGGSVLSDLTITAGPEPDTDGLMRITDEALYVRTGPVWRRIELDLYVS